MFKVNNKDTRTTLFHPSSDFMVNFEQVNAGWEYLMVSKVQEEFHHFFVLTMKVGLEIGLRIKIIS